MIVKRNTTITKVTCGIKNNELTTTFYFSDIERKSKSFYMGGYEQPKNVKQTLELFGKRYIEELVGAEVTLVFDKKEKLVAISKRNGRKYVLMPDEFYSCGKLTKKELIEWMKK